MENFLSLGLPEQLVQSLSQMDFNQPTPIQVQSIPFALEGKDILGSAQTGTGKTAAFGIPLVAKLLNNPTGSALVMTPTRELAAQVMATLESLLGKQGQIKTALLIGGEPMPKQLKKLRQRPRLIVGTPGRINDHLTRKSLKLNDTNFLVLDETDRMLDMGFTIQIDQILKHMRGPRQTLLFSATLPEKIISMSKKYLQNPERVSVGSTTLPAAEIAQEIIHVTLEEKYKKLTEQLLTRNGSVLIFVKTKRNADRMAKKLRGEDHSAEAIHGDLRQNKRDKVIANFRKRKHRILVATDIAARGLDIPHIEHVINYDLPQCPEDYIHRIGRTARAGAEGSALCLISDADRSKWNAINRLINPDAAKADKPKRRSGKKRSGAPSSDGVKKFRRNGPKNGGPKNSGQKNRRPKNKSSNNSGRKAA